MHQTLIIDAGNKVMNKQPKILTIMELCSISWEKRTKAIINKSSMSEVQDYYGEEQSREGQKSVLGGDMAILNRMVGGDI